MICDNASFDPSRRSDCWVTMIKPGSKYTEDNIFQQQMDIIYGIAQPNLLLSTSALTVKKKIPPGENDLRYRKFRSLPEIGLLGYADYTWSQFTVLKITFHQVELIIYGTAQPNLLSTYSPTIWTLTVRSRALTWSKSAK